MEIIPFTHDAAWQRRRSLVLADHTNFSCNGAIGVNHGLHMSEYDAMMQLLKAQWVKHCLHFLHPARVILNTPMNNSATLITCIAEEFTRFLKLVYADW
jgi:hypothetical protein